MSIPDGDAALAELAAAMGVALTWRDIAGTEHRPGPDTLRALLNAMGVDASDPVSALAAHRAEQAARTLPHELTLRTDGHAMLRLSGPWRLLLEGGGVREGVADRFLRLSPPPGLHVLEHGSSRCLLIVAPPRAPSVAEATGRQRIWGATTALYALRSARDLGVGDAAELGAAAEALGAFGADFIGINPVHARGAAHDGISPYSPASRIALDPGLIAPEAVPGFAENAEAQALWTEAAEGIARARAGDMAHYRAREAAVAPILRALFEGFRDDDGTFAAWRAGPGAALEGFALFEALSMRLGGDWRFWPRSWFRRWRGWCCPWRRYWRAR
ncbi:MAG: 4-alpha-glucanotransferase, partial [Rubrimonas sp.]